MNFMRKLVLTLVIIGAINWGLIGFFKYDLVSSMFGGQSGAVSRIIFALVGLSGIYALSFFHQTHEETTHKL